MKKPNEVMSIIKTLKDDIKLNTVTAKKAENERDYYIKMGIVEGLKIAIDTIKEEYGDDNIYYQ